MRPSGDLPDHQADIQGHVPLPAIASDGGKAVFGKIGGQCLGTGEAHCVQAQAPGVLHRLAEELHADPVVAALNGGEDHELLFTVPLAMQEQVMKMGCVDVIGHITPESTGAYLVTPDGSDIRLRAQGFAEKE